jgi:uncharacterized protein YbjQ (UPF0145 family)
MTEFTAIGTAIRLPGVREAKTVFTSDLVGQEFWQLYNAGYVPRELAFGVCSYYVKCDEATRQIIDPTLWNLVSGTSMANQEVLIFTQGFYDARNRAMSRLTSSAINAGADGLVSMDADYTVQTIQYQAWNKTFHDLVIHFVATGTSIAREQRADTAKPAGKPLVCVNLKRGSSRAFELQSDYGFEPADLDDEELLETDLGE